MTNNTNSKSVSNSASANINEFISLSWEKTHSDYDRDASLNAKTKIYAFDGNGKLGILFTSNVTSKWCLDSAESDHRFNQADDGWTPEIIEVFENEAGDKFMSKDNLFKSQYEAHELGVFYSRKYIRFDTMIADGWCGGAIYEHLGIYYLECEREKILMTNKWIKAVVNQLSA